MIKKPHSDKCDLCYPTQSSDPQLAIIIKNLIEKIKTTLIQSKFSKEQTASNEYSFYQLTKTILQGSKLYKQVHVQCNHDVLKTYIVELFNVQEYIFYVACQKVCSFIIKRRYEMQTIKNMAKNFPKTILNRSISSKHRIKHQKRNKQPRLRNKVQQIKFVQQKKQQAPHNIQHESKQKSQIKLQHVQNFNICENNKSNQAFMFWNYQNQMNNYCQQPNQRFFNPFLFNYGLSTTHDKPYFNFQNQQTKKDE